MTTGADLQTAARQFRDATSSPDDVPALLRSLAQACFDDAGELESTWQDAGAGKPWEIIGRELEACADRIGRALGRRVMTRGPAIRMAIETRFIGPTDHRGARVKAVAAVRTDSFPAIAVTVPWNHSLGIQENHIAAARTLAAKQEWNGRWHAGGKPDDRGYAFVLVEGEPAFEISEGASCESI